jgi:hypothetical protein
LLSTSIKQVILRQEKQSTWREPWQGQCCSEGFSVPFAISSPLSTIPTAL